MEPPRKVDICLARFMCLEPSFGQNAAPDSVFIDAVTAAESVSRNFSEILDSSGNIRIVLEAELPESSK